jgi:DNA-binding FadR family transcriptional regulator
MKAAQARVGGAADAALEHNDAVTAGDDDLTPERRRRAPLGVRVAEQIRADISQGKLVAGDELPSESQYADRFGVSQRVVRDALRTLNNEGIISTRQGKRAVVGDLRPAAVGNYMRFLLDADVRAIDELMEFRALLEGRAARLAAERANESDVTQMRQAMKRIVDTGDDLSARVPADLSLHELISRSCGNRFVHTMLIALSDTLAEERRKGAQITQSAGVGHDETDQQHQALIDAIAARDGDEAERRAIEIVRRALGFWTTSLSH